MASRNSFVFYGSADISAKLLRKIIELGFVPKAIITVKPKPSGRGLKVSPSLISDIAHSHSIPLIEVGSFKDSLIVEKIFGFKTDYALLFAFGKIIPQQLLALYEYGILNIHPSLLPHYRGPAPIQTALLDGIKTTGVTLIKLDEMLDHGPIISQKSLPIETGDNYQLLEEKVIETAVHIFVNCIDNYLDQSLAPIDQDHARATYTKMITKEDGLIDWSKPALDIFNSNRAFSQWPGVWSTYKGKRLKLIQIELITTGIYSAGRVQLQGGRLVVGCGQGAIAIIQLQMEGKKIISANDFLLGNKEIIGSTLPT